MLGVEDASSKTFVFSAKPPKAILPKSKDTTDFLEWNPTEIARQITIIEYNIFRKITPKECFALGWNKKDKNIQSPNIVALIERFNVMSAWISTMIVREEVFKRRVALLTHWIRVAQECKELHNFNGVVTIISALNNSGIHRMRKTKEQVPKKEIGIYQELCDLVSQNNSYKNLRAAVKTSHPPCIPYIGMFLTDLTFIEDGNKDTWKMTEMINFFKRRKIAQIIMEIRNMQCVPYHFEKVPVLYQLLETCETVWSDDEIYEQSLKLEPRVKSTSA